MIIRKYALICVAITWFVVSFGFVLPRTISSDSWFSFLFGVSYLGITPVIIIILWPYITNIWNEK